MFSVKVDLWPSQVGRDEGIELHLLEGPAMLTGKISYSLAMGVLVRFCYCSGLCD